MTSALTDQARAALDSLGGADLLVGIPSYNNATTIGYVVQTAAEGLARHFPEQRGVVFNSDGGSNDGTPDAVRAATVPDSVRSMSFPYVGPSGKGSAFHAIFEAAVSLGVRACVVLDSDLRSVTPAWVDLLARPLIAGDADYVAPLYTRHKYDGTITNNLAYPLTRALYGVRVRQPIGGDFGIGRRVLDAYLSPLVAGGDTAPDIWQSDIARFGIDIWMTTTALAGGFRVAQAVLGTKVHDPKDPAASLGPMFTQVVGTLFTLMARYAGSWRHVRHSSAPQEFGVPVPGEPEPVEVDLEALVTRFREGLSQHGALWQQVLEPDTYHTVAGLTQQEPQQFTFPPDDWVRAVYDFACAYNDPRQTTMQGRPTSAALMDALTPLYFGRTAGLVVDTLSFDSDAFEAYLEVQAQAFERHKPYLLQRWPSSAGS